MKIIKQRKTFAVFNDDGGLIGRYNDIVSAAAVMRYLSGVNMTEYEKMLALSALSDNGDLLQTVNLPSRCFSAFYVNPLKLLFSPQGNNSETVEMFKAIIEADTPPANSVLTVIGTDNELQYCCIE